MPIRVPKGVGVYRGSWVPIGVGVSIGMHGTLYEVWVYIRIHGCP